MKHVDCLFKTNSIHSSISATPMVFYYFKHTVAAESFKRFCIHVF